MMTRYFMIFGICVATVAGSAAASAADPSATLQAMLDAAEPGARVAPPPGVYSGPIKITKPVIFDGGHKVIIDNNGQGTVLEVAADDVVVQGVTLRNSGTLHDAVDAGLRVSGTNVTIRDNDIVNCLFGLDLKKTNKSLVQNNRITSQALELGIRGDAIRLWYSFDNEISDNRIDESRDMVVWYSERNRVLRNDISNGRYGIHMMYGHRNLIEHNSVHDNIVGLFLMYSDHNEVRHNRIAYSKGESGMGIGFKESSSTVIENNDVYANAWGLYFDLSPMAPEDLNRIDGNRVAFNGIGVVFHNPQSGNQFRANDFVSNFTQVMVRDGGSAKGNQWQGNHWDTFEGFDRDQDGVGDAPYHLYAYADRVWMDVPPARFFRGSPVLEMLDFLERLAPFSNPTMLLADEQPRMAPVVARSDAGAGKERL